MEMHAIQSKQASLSSSCIVFNPEITPFSRFQVEFSVKDATIRCRLMQFVQSHRQVIRSHLREH